MIQFKKKRLTTKIAEKENGEFKKVKTLLKNSVRLKDLKYRKLNVFFEEE
jgi:hypothetical protein